MKRVVASLFASVCVLAAASTQARGATTYAYDASGRPVVSIMASSPWHRGTNAVGYDPRGNRATYNMSGALLDSALVSPTSTRRSV